jgi:hypothetical protein
MNFRLSNPIRRLVAALAVAQMAVTVAVPLAEARLERAPGPVSIEQQHTKQCVTIHRPGACLLCQHAAVRAPAARSVPLPGAGRELAVTAREAIAHPAASDDRFVPPPRAPPRHSA